MAKNTPGVQICTRGANLHPGANCAHERGLRKKIRQLSSVENRKPCRQITQDHQEKGR